MTIDTVKTVTFDRIVTVVLIPIIQEYKDAKIAKDIWYNATEMRNLKTEYVIENYPYVKNPA
jgi:hypothetical protein